jgi:hypothetical protein
VSESNVKRFLVLGLVASCTPVPADPVLADCALLPNIVRVTPGRVEVRAGLSTWSEPIPNDVSGAYDRVAGWRKGRLRPACSGASDVVFASDDTPSVQVLIAGVALARSCDAPTRFALAVDGAPVPVSGLHFCGCRPMRPLAHCSSTWIMARAEEFEVRRTSRLIGGPDCSPGAKPLPSMGDHPPEAPQPVQTIHASLDEALHTAASAHGGLPACPDAFVEFEGRPRWGELRRALAKVHGALPQRLTVLLD